MTIIDTYDRLITQDIPAIEILQALVLHLSDIDIKVSIRQPMRSYRNDHTRVNLRWLWPPCFRRREEFYNNQTVSFKGYERLCRCILGKCVFEKKVAHSRHRYQT